MKKRYPVYDQSTITEIKKLVDNCSDWLSARKIISESLGIHPDNATRMNKKYGFWISDDDLESEKPLFKSRKMKRLFMDIETSPNVVLSWRIGYKINLEHSNILKERAIICIGYKWEGEKEVYALHWDENQNDKKMLEDFLKIANDADEIVMHNGDKFDLPWFKTRCIFHGLTPLPSYKTVDTLQWARRKFYFNSNKLDYIAKFLGLEGKIKTEYNLWKEIVLNKSSASMKLMLDYCKKDVCLLESVWKRLSLVVSHKTHVGVLNGSEKWACPHCGSKNVKLHKVKVTASGTTQFEMKCEKCSAYYTISKSDYSDFLNSLV
jgi:DNA polymerase elongation subunit (family B)